MANHLALLLYVHLTSALDGALHTARSNGLSITLPAASVIDDDPSAPATSRRFGRGDATGQATTEYALVLLAAALVGLMVVAWATAGGGAQRISRLFNGVIDAVIDRI